MERRAVIDYGFAFTHILTDCVINMLISFRED